MGFSVNTEEYDGTSWATVNNMVTHKRSMGGAGTQTAGFTAGGLPSAQSSVTHEYDGTSWTVGGTLLAVKHYPGTWGSLTAGLVIGNNSYSAASEIYDGTCWSAGDNSPAGKNLSYGIGNSGGGTAGLHHGGQNASTVQLATTYKYAEALTARTVTDS
jgi:hypothetical protein